MLLILLCSIVFFYIIKSIYVKQKRPPGPWSVPFLGYLPFLDSKAPHISFTKLSKKYGRIYGVQLGSIYTVVLSDIALIRDALKRDEFTGRAPLYVTHGIMGGYGIICAEGTMWRDMRKLSIEWLRKLGMTRYGMARDNMESGILEGVKTYEQDITDAMERSFSVDPHNMLHNALGNVMNRIVFGIKYEKDDETWKYLQHLQEEGVKHIGISGAVNFMPLLRYLPSNFKTLEFLLDGKQKTHKLYDQIIQTCQNNIQTYKDCILKCFLFEREKRQAMNDAGQLENFSDLQLRHMLADLFGAGVDTTLTTIRWFILFTGMKTEIQTKIRDEMRTALGNKSPNLNDIDRLSYFKAAIAETQRIRSVTPLGIPHATLKEIEIENYKIPEGTMIVPLLWAVHMNEHDWKDPHAFDPSRFITANGEVVVPPNLIPFQTGKRMCLGEELAKMILFLFCANFVHYFTYELINPSDIDINGICGITLMPPKYELTLVRNSMCEEKQTD